MTNQLGTPREGLMSTAASLSSVVKPRFIKPVGERTCNGPEKFPFLDLFVLLLFCASS
jgi:hypothetical protein